MVDAEEVLKPEWVRALEALAPIAGGLATIGTNPEQWVKSLVAEWFVGGALDALQYVVGWIIYAFEIIRREILQAAGPLASPYLLLESATVGMIETMYRGARIVPEMAGLAGPPAAALSVAILSAFLALVAYALIYVALNWIPGGGILEGAEENLES